MAPVVGPTMQGHVENIKPISVRHDMISLESTVADILQSTAGSGIEIFTATKSASRVLDIIPTGGTGSELYLTLKFEWEQKKMEADSQEAAQKQKQYQETDPRDLNRTLEKMRELAREEKI
jgi:hypothetical protein